jgi:hypothetical protein
MTMSVEPLSAHQGTLLDAASLDVLFLELSDEVDVCEVHLEDGTRAHPRKRSASLEEAHEALRVGATPGVQIHYYFQGDAWWDTLLRTDQGFRLIRQHLPLSEHLQSARPITMGTSAPASPSVGALENLFTV